MAITFNTNIAALGAQRNIGISSTNAGSSLQKLSSGSRVPQAKDDAAALAIGSKLKAEVAGLTQASNNAGQAISLLQIADGALATSGDILQRMKALAVQASSGQLADSDRSLLNQEFTSLQSEVGRIAALTNFNGTTLLNGGDVVATPTEVQSGYLDGKGIAIGFNTATTAASGAFRVDYNYVSASSADMTVTNMTTGAKQTVNVATAIEAKTGVGALTTNLSAGQTLDVNFDAVGVTLTLDSRFDADTDLNQAFTPSTTSTVQASVRTNSTVTMLSGGDMTAAQLTAITAFDSATGNLTINVADNVDDTLTISATTGLEFSKDNITYGATASLTVNAATANTLFIRAAGATQAFSKITIAAAADVVGASGSASSTLVVGSLGNGMLSMAESSTTTRSFDFKVGTGITSDDKINFTLSAATTAALGIDSSAIDTATHADSAITAVGSAITTISSRRADIGAAESRLAFAQNSINVAVENTTAAQSSLLDVDVSAEITKFTNQNVLMQAGISLLGQANQQPALLLRLLQ